MRGGRHERAHRRADRGPVLAPSAGRRRRSRATWSARIDPVTLAAFRFGIGVAGAAAARAGAAQRLPRGRDWIGVALLGVLFFAVFFVLLQHRDGATRRRRAARSRSRPCRSGPWWSRRCSAPSRSTARKTLGVADRGRRRRARARRGPRRGAARRLARRSHHDRRDAVHGVLQCLVAAVHRALLAARLRHRLDGGRRGLPRRSSRPRAAALRSRASFEPAQWIAVIYLGVFGGAAAFFLWVLALRMTTPTRVANTMTVNPIAASLLAAVHRERADRAQSDRGPGRGCGRDLARLNRQVAP